MRRWLERVRPGCDAFLVSFALVVRPRYRIGAYGGKGARAGYTYLHTAIDGFSRLAYTEALDDEKASTTIGFFCRARASMASPGSCGSSPTTGRTTAPRASSRTSRPWPHAIRGSAPTPHGTMARSSATTASWPRSASTPAPTPHSSSATTPSQPPPVGRRLRRAGLCPHGTTLKPLFACGAGP